MRRMYVVCYDIGDSSRLNRIRQRLSGHAFSNQKSVYECLFSSRELTEFENWLKIHIDAEADSVLIFSVESDKHRRCFGRTVSERSDVFLVT